MIIGFTQVTAYQYQDILGSTHKLRHKCFIGRMGWDIPKWNGMEYDQFDNLSTVYLVWRDSNNVVRGTCRLAPTDRPYMIKDVWPHIVTKIDLPASPFVFEASRLCVDHHLPGDVRRRVISEMVEKSLIRLKTNPPTSLSSLLGIEGGAAYMYFKAWKGLPMQWKKSDRRPVPDDWRVFNARNSLRSQTGWHATHPMNAMLNYAYGVLESHIRIAIITAGLDPRIGYLHVSTYDHSLNVDKNGLIFDLMEPLRAIIDRKIIEFIKSNALSSYDFIIGKTGICRLHPQLARHIVSLVQDIDGIDTVVPWLITLLKANLKPEKRTIRKRITVEVD